MSDSMFRKADELTRRHFMSGAARTYLGVHLLPMLGSTVASARTEDAAMGKAKHVIYLYMSGGMSHVDTFDPKPKKKEIMGKTEAIPTNVDGLMVGHYLKKTAEVMDKVCVINSMNSTQGAHQQGTYVMQTSYTMRGTTQHPSVGSWVLKLAGKIHPELPGYVAIDSPPDHTGGGFFGAKYAAAPIGSPGEGLKDSRLSRGVTEDNFGHRLSLADKLNRQFHGRYPNVDVKAYEELYREAVALMKSKDLVAFDLKLEPESVRNLYGTGRFAQGCLLARRLVQHGVRFVEVQLGGWDTHFDNFTGVEGRCKEFDQAYAALLTDLEKTGMLKDTLVVVATEFGRSPTIDKIFNDGRGHHPAAFSCLLAGGSVKGGTRYGETDATGSRVKDGLVTVQDFNATIAYGLGLPFDKVEYSPSKRPFQIGDNGVPIKSIFS
jgi:hypothetical protein